MVRRWRLASLAVVLGGLALGATACQPAPTPTPRTIDLLGDSITWQAYWGRTRTFESAGRPAGSDLVVDAAPGRLIQDPQDRETARVYSTNLPRPETLVIALGTNNALPKTGGWTSDDTAAFRKLVFTPSSKACVVVVLPGLATKGTVTATMAAEMTEARAAMRTVIADRAKASPTIIRDWGALVAANATLTEPDGIHLPAGDALAAAADVYARTIWSGVAACPT